MPVLLIGYGENVSSGQPVKTVLLPPTMHGLEGNGRWPTRTRWAGWMYLRGRKDIRKRLLVHACEYSRRGIDVVAEGGCYFAQSARVALAVVRV